MILFHPESTASEIGDISDADAVEPAPKPSSAHFEIYSDPTENVATSKPAATALPFEIFCDENAPRSAAKNPSSGPAAFEIYCDEEPEKIPVKPDFVKPLPVPKFGVRQTLANDDKENKAGVCHS